MRGWTMRGWTILAAVTVAAILPLLAPFGDADGIALITTIAISAYLAVSWNVVGGMAGQLSFGHSIFLSAGGYASSVLMIERGWNPLLGALVGVALAVVLGAAMAYLAARYALSHLAFALITAAFSMVGLFFVKSTETLGGAFGVSLPFDVTGAQLYFRDDRVYYWIFLGMTVAAVLITLVLRHSRLGTYCAAIRESELAAQGLGINLVRTKIASMAISAALTAAGGAMYAHYIRFLDPESFLGFTRSLDIAIPALLGGTATITGPLVGAVIYGVIVEEFSRFTDTPGGSGIVLGILLAVIVFWLPDGIVPSLSKKVAARRRDRRARRTGSRLPDRESDARADKAEPTRPTHWPAAVAGRTPDD